MDAKILAVIGLGNPGRQYEHNRHNIGFQIVDALADKYGSTWKSKEHMELAEITIKDHKVFLIKPQTFMNSSGKVVPFLTKQGVKPQNIVVVHDELELPFGQIKIKMGGSHKGHNGLKSIIAACGADFVRLRFGIGRPENREDVPNYVLQNFKESHQEMERLINEAVHMVEQLLEGASYM